jgi:hypothetical protein
LVSRSVNLSLREGLYLHFVHIIPYPGPALVNFA